MQAQHRPAAECRAERPRPRRCAALSDSAPSAGALRRWGRCPTLRQDRPAHRVQQHQAVAGLPREAGPARRGR